MLVLTRQRDEEVILDIGQALRTIFERLERRDIFVNPEILVAVSELDEKVRVSVVNIRGDKVKLGIHAPRVIPIHRKEVQSAIEKEREEANT